MSQPQQRVVLYPIPLSTLPSEQFSASDEWLLLQDAIIQTDLQFNITGWNSTAELLYHFTGAFGKNLFEIIDLKFVKGSLEDLKLEMACSSCWKGEMIYTKSNGEKIFFLTIANYIVNEKKRPVSIMLVSHNITDAKKKEQQLAETENEYKTLVNTLFDGVLMIKSDEKISACNERAAQIFGIKQQELIGYKLCNSSWKAIKPDGSEFPIEEFPALITLQTGIGKRDVLMGIIKPDGQKTWVSINSKPIKRGLQEKPDAVVVTLKDITEEKAKGEKLTKAEALFGSFLKNSQTAVWIYNTEGKILMANDVYDRITNSPGKAEGKYIMEIFPNDFGKMLCRRNEELLKNETPIVTSTELTQSDGSIRNFLSYLFVIKLPGGRKLIGGQALDITEEKTATDKLKESESIFRMFMSSSPALGWIYDEYGNLLFGNPNFMKELGYTKEALGKNIDELAPNKYIHDLVTTRINNVLLNNLQSITEDVIIGNDESRKVYNSIWFLMPLENGKRLIGGHAIDITEKKKNTAALKLATERFALALKVTADAIWDLDLKTNEIFRSDQFSTISGYRKEQIGSNLNWWFDRIHPEEKDRVQSKVQAYLDLRKETWEDQYRFLFADGTYRHIQDRGFAIYENNIPVRLVGSIKDITEKIELEKNLIEEQLQRQKQLTLATIRAQEMERDEISKELHDNVNQILMSAKLYMNTAREHPEGQDYLMDKAIEYQMMAVEEIRKLSKVLSNSLINTIGLNQSIEGIVYNMQSLNGLTVNYSFSNDLEQRLSNNQKLMVLRIIQEQTNNILKHARATLVHIDISDYGDMVSLFIKDNGVGFDSNLHTKGIGLVNISNRSEALNGKMKVSSKPGGGCVLELIFPINGI